MKLLIITVVSLIFVAAVFGIGAWIHHPVYGPLNMGKALLMRKKEKIKRQKELVHAVKSMSSSNERI